MPSFPSTLAHVSAVCVILFAWSSVTWAWFGVWWLISQGESATAIRGMRYSIAAAIVFGAGMVVLGGVALAWDVLTGIQ